MNEPNTRTDWSVPDKSKPATLIPYRRGNKWGYADPDRKVVIDCIYDRTEFPQHEGLIVVSLEGKAGAIDRTGRVVIPFEYEAGQAGDGPIAMKKNGLWGFFDQSGAAITKPLYDRVHGFAESLCAVQLKKKYGFIDATGQMVIPATYSSVSSFRHGVASATAKKQFLIDRQGQPLFPEVYDLLISLRQEGYYMVELKKKYGIIDQTGRIIVPIEYSSWPEIDDMGWVLLRQGKKSGFTALGTTPVPESLRMPSVYSNFYPFDENIAIVFSQDNKVGWVDRSGKELVPPIYGQVGNFHEGLADFTHVAPGYTSSNMLYGFLDTAGREVIMMDYEDSRNGFDQGIASVKKHGKYGFIDRTGRTVIDFKYGAVDEFVDGYALAYIGDLDDYDNVIELYIDRQGNEFYEA